MIERGDLMIFKINKKSQFLFLANGMMFLVFFLWFASFLFFEQELFLVEFLFLLLLLLAIFYIVWITFVYALFSSVKIEGSMIELSEFFRPQIVDLTDAKKVILADVVLRVFTHKGDILNISNKYSDFETILLIVSKFIPKDQWIIEE
jgi:hypothetical protein